MLSNWVDACRIQLSPLSFPLSSVPSLSCVKSLRSENVLPHTMAWVLSSIVSSSEAKIFGLFARLGSSALTICLLWTVAAGHGDGRGLFKAFWVWGEEGGLGTRINTFCFNPLFPFPSSFFSLILFLSLSLFSFLFSFPFVVIYNTKKPKFKRR